MGILWPTRERGCFQCRWCKRKYVWLDSRERHEREQHGTQYEREEGKRRREADRAARARLKHKELQSTVVEAALRFWRWMPKPGGGGDAEKFWKACAALEKFETED
jgi:hypothetical protein